MASVGLTEAKKWLIFLKKEGIASREALDNYENRDKLYFTLVTNTTSDLEKKSLSVLLKLNCDDTNNYFQIIHLLGLDKFYSHKLHLRDALLVRQNILNLITKGEGCSKLTDIPFLVLNKLMSYDVNCRSDLMLDDTDSSCDSDDDETKDESIHPMDCLHALLLCCDDFLRQNLFSRLAKCQLSVPLLMPDPIKKHFIFPIWSMRGILKEWKPKGANLVSESVVTYRMPIVSFLRFGQHQRKGISKSKIMNSLISGLEQSPFFHRDCSGGHLPRVFSEGLVDMSWYTPAGKPTDKFDDIVAFINLHGDAHEHVTQAQFISQISSLCFILIVNDNFTFENRDLAILKALNESCGGLMILNGVDTKVDVCKKQNFNNSHIINIADMTNPKIVNSISKKIKSNLPKLERLTIENIKKFKLPEILIDENLQACRDGYEYVVKIKKFLECCNGDISNLKNSIVPLQGEALWQTWAKLDKEFNRHLERGAEQFYEYSEIIQEKKKLVRKEQFQKVSELSKIMETFLNTFLELNGDSNYFTRNYFLQSLKLELNKHSREKIGEKYPEFLKLQRELAYPSNTPLGGEIEQKASEFEILQTEIVNCSLGLEHLLREVGQIYEASHSKGSHKSYCEKLSQVAAEAMIDGYPLELMDGDASHVPIEWITAVLDDLIKKLGDQKVFVLSVLGIQSTGKSTMLNTMFGLQFNVSAGRCTRGAFMQLIPLDDTIKLHTGCHYILIVDTEGLQAQIMTRTDKEKHDNELATFVIGLANMTLINVMGEVGNLDDILQTSVHAFLRMKLVEIKPSCQFVHHHSGVSIQSDVEHAIFTQKLNQFTRDAAKTEKCDEQYKKFDDVIKFNDTKDFHQFPGLWKGDPPMAPINEGYSEKTQLLKHHIIGKIDSRASQNSEKILSGHNLSGFKLLLSSLWEALKKENFVFSFKNTLEITAYSRLETEFSKWEWIFKEEIINWNQKSDNQIKAAKVTAVSDLVVNQKIHLAQCVHTLYEDLKQKKDVFFSGEHSEILIKWKGAFDIRLKSLSCELQKEAEDYCNKLLHTKQEFSNFEKIIQSLVEQIQRDVHENVNIKKKEKVQFQNRLERGVIESQDLKNLIDRCLFAEDKLLHYKSFLDDKKLQKIVNLKKKRNDLLSEDDMRNILTKKLSLDEVKMVLKHCPQLEEQLQSEFDKIWGKFISQIEYVRTDKTMKVIYDIQQALTKFISAKGYGGELIKKLNERPFKEWKDFSLEPNSEQHYTKLLNQAKVWDSGVHYLGKVSSKIMPNEVTKIFQKDNFFLAAQQATESIIFNASEVINKIKKRQMDFSSSFVDELLIHVADSIPKACQGIGNIISFTIDYEIDLYIKICSNAVPEFEEIAVNFEDRNDPIVYLNKYKRAPIYTKYKNQYKQTEAEVAIADTLCAYLENPIVNQIKQSLGPKIISKLRNSVSYLDNKSRLKVQILLDSFDGNDYDYKKIIVYIKNIQQSLLEHIDNYIIQFCDQKVNEELTELQFTAIEEFNKTIGNIIDVVKQLTHTNDNVQEWLKTFCEKQQLHSLVGINISMEDIMAGYETVAFLHLGNLKEKIIGQLNEMKDRARLSLETIKGKEEINNWHHKPRELLQNLIGCTECCPLCGEQCDYFQHGNERDHKTAVHRIDCLAGWRIKKSQLMHTGFCPDLVASDLQFYISDDKLHSYKNYKEIFPNWSIPADMTSSSALYWRKFIYINKNKLAFDYHALPAKVPSQWQKYKGEDIIADLKRLYNI